MSYLIYTTIYESTLAPHIPSDPKSPDQPGSTGRIIKKDKTGYEVGILIVECRESNPGTWSTCTA